MWAEWQAGGAAPLTLAIISAAQAVSQREVSLLEATLQQAAQRVEQVEVQKACRWRVGFEEGWGGGWGALSYRAEQPGDSQTGSRLRRTAGCMVWAARGGAHGRLHAHGLRLSLQRRWQGAPHALSAARPPRRATACRGACPAKAAEGLTHNGGRPRKEGVVHGSQATEPRSGGLQRRDVQHVCTGRDSTWSPRQDTHHDGFGPRSWDCSRTFDGGVAG